MNQRKVKEMSYTYNEKENMMSKVLDIAEVLTGKGWHEDGGYIADNDNMMVINIYDYMDDFTSKEENGDLIEYVQRLINEEKERL